MSALIKEPPEIVIRPWAQSDLNPKQLEANELLASDARHILLYGGSRSGKTFILCRAIICRAMQAPGSTHTILREHFNHLKHSVIYDTMPRVLNKCFPGIAIDLNASDWYHALPNGSHILYDGLDDKERTEKILGQEHSTIYLNEASNISYGARNKAVTRLTQNAGLKLKAYYDCNPPSQGHWLYSVFIKKQDPLERKPLNNPDNYASMQLNPWDNIKHLPDGYISELDDLPGRDRLRFRDGMFLPQVQGALWSVDMFKHEPAPIGEQQFRDLRDRMEYITVAVDPSGTSGPEDERSDEVGIVVVGCDRQENGYVLEDMSGRYSPERWARLVISLFDKWQTDNIVAEINFGGDMVRAVIESVRRHMPVKKITASRGKHIRAEPVAALYEKGRIIHIGEIPDLEDQYLNFSTAGYMGERSPDRADAAIFGLSDLLLGKQQYFGIHYAPGLA